MRLVAVVALLAAVVIAVGVTDSVAHGSHGHHAAGRAIIVTLAADHGPAAAGWRCTVFAPDGAPWTEGVLDREGRIAFVPDRAGMWRVRAFAADGHGAELEVEVDAAMLEALSAGASADDPTSAAPRVGAWPKLVTGLGVLFGVFGCLALIQAGRR